MICIKKWKIYTYQTGTKNMNHPFLLKFPPPDKQIETTSVFKKAISAHRALAELKGTSQTIPNQEILINTLSLHEAKDSSAIENIITTHDELYKEDIFSDFINNTSAKEVKRYSIALKKGFDLVKANGLITNNHLFDIQTILVQNRSGFRRLPGTELKNDKTGKIIYIPPQNHEDILKLMKNLEQFINDDSMSGLDPLIKMALIHHQFESIHPFYDGNGRTGRILNILYLVQKGLLEIPILYLSRYIIKNKDIYYNLLQNVRENEDWEKWVIFMLEGVEQTSKTTIDIINNIRNLMLDYKHKIRESFKFYSQDLLNNLFCHPYTKIEFLVRDIKVNRLTSTKYLEQLTEAGFLRKEKLGRSNYYINIKLFDILTGN